MTKNFVRVQGDANWDIWDEDCTFADPFSSFGGKGSLERFQKNAKNLGGLVKNPIGKVRNFVVNDMEESDKQILLKYLPNRGEDYKNVAVVKVGWSFTSKLKLPWNPILSATGVTSHYLNKDDNSKIFLYVETWKSKPFDVVLRLLRPTRSEVAADYDFKK